MATRVLVLLGTKKGGFILESDQHRSSWRLHGPLCEGWPIYHMTHDPATGTLYAAGGNSWFGPGVWRSEDLGKRWTLGGEGLTYGESGPAVQTVWHVASAHGTLYAGVDPAGLFRSEDHGATWTHVSGLRTHPSCSAWQAGYGGLCLHSIVPHPSDPAQLWVAISAAGTFHTADGGATWALRNHGVRADFLPQHYPAFGQCVHKLIMAPDQPDYLYQQNHCGVYRSADGGEGWDEITEGLPSQFGFPMAVHPRSPDTVYVIPLNGEAQGRYAPDGRMAVWRSRDAGDTWSALRTGLPQEDAYIGVLREALTVDTLEPAGVYFGTSTGQVFASRDEGERWAILRGFLPPIYAVETAVIDG